MPVLPKKATSMINNSVSYYDDLIESLRDPIERAAYINAALEDGDKKVLLKALRNANEAEGVKATNEDLTDIIISLRRRKEPTRNVCVFWKSMKKPFATK